MYGRKNFLTQSFRIISSFFIGQIVFFYFFIDFFLFLVVLFEYDKRFAVYGSDFTFYDYNSPMDIPKQFQKSFDIVVADPPFLSEECLDKTSQTIKFLAKDKIILCTGIFQCL